jgi:SAM-dependent methyltransferase
VEFIQLDATAMPFREAFDIVGAFDVIEHVDADERVIQGVHQGLRRGGLFIIMVPQHAWMWSALDDAVHHKRRYSRSDLLEKVRDNGFDVLFCSSFVTLLFPAMVAVRLLSGRQRPANRSDREVIASAVTLAPGVSRICDRLMWFDELAIKARISLPCGGSLLAIARKR